MTARKVRVDYDALDEIAKSFDREAEDTRRTLNQLHKDLDVLLDGDWVGRGATEFYQEMISDVLPAVKRLGDALEQAARATHQMSQIMKQAEDDSARLFTIDWGDYFSERGCGLPAYLADDPGPFGQLLQQFLQWVNSTWQQIDQWWSGGTLTPTPTFPSSTPTPTQTPTTAPTQTPTNTPTPTLTPTQTPTQTPTPVLGPAAVNESLLTPAGKAAFEVYRALWDSPKDKSWWTDPVLGGDGDFSVKDFVTLVMARELSGAYGNPYFLAPWTEALVRSNRGWRIDQEKRFPQANLDPATNEGLLNWVLAQSGVSTRTSPAHFEGGVPAAVPVAKDVVEAIINSADVGHPEWAEGWAADRPYAVGSYNASIEQRGYPHQLKYIYSYIKTVCSDNAILLGNCGADQNFAFILTGAQSKSWSKVTDTPEVIAEVLKISLEEAAKLAPPTPR